MSGPEDRHLAKDTVWSIANETAGLVAVTLSFTLLGVKLQPAGYGAFLGLTSVVGPLAAFASGGVFLTLLEFIARRDDSAADVTRSCVTLALGTGTLAAMLASTVVLLSVPGLGAVTVVLLCCNDLVLASLFFTLAGAVQIELGFASSARIRIGMHLSRSAMLVFLFLTDNVRLFPYAIGQMVTLMLFCAILTFVVQRHFGRSIYFGRSRVAHLRSVSLYAVGLSAVGVQNDGDKFALNRAGYAADAGRYGFGYRLVQLGLLPITALAGSTHISFLESAKQARPIERARRFGGYAALYGTLAVAILWVGAPWCEQLLPGQFADTAMIIRWLAPLVLLRGVGIFAMNGLLGFGLNHLRTRLLVANAALSVILYIVLVPPHSWRGAAAATLISEVTLMASTWITLIYQQRKADRHPPELHCDADVDDARRTAAISTEVERAQIALDGMEAGEVW